MNDLLNEQAVDTAILIAVFIITGLLLWFVISLTSKVLDVLYKLFVLLFEVLSFIGRGFRRLFLFIAGIIGISYLAKQGRGVKHD